MKWIFPILMLLLAARVTAQGLVEGYDVPYPTEYEVRYTSDGKAYVVVRKFTRRQTGTYLAPRVAGIVRHVRHAPQGRAHVTLRAGNGMTFGVRTGETFAFGGRQFEAVGFQSGFYVVRCRRTGQTFTFRQ